MRSASRILAMAVALLSRTTGNAAYVDVISWDGPEYHGAWVVDKDAYSEIGQTFVAHSNGFLAGLTLVCARSADTRRIRIAVYEFDATTGTKGALVKSSDFDVSTISLDLLTPTEHYFEFVGGAIAKGGSYIFTMQVLEGSAFYLQANVADPYSDGQMWWTDAGVWKSFGDDDSDFKVWLNSPEVPVPLSGVVVGVGLATVSCLNVSTGQLVIFRPKDSSSWNCADAGLVVHFGDQVLQLLAGQAK